MLANVSPNPQTPPVKEMMLLKTRSTRRRDTGERDQATPTQRATSDGPMQQRDERANERERERERDRKQQQRDVLFDPSMLSFVMPASQDIVLDPSIKVVVVVQYLWCIGGHSFGWRERLMLVRDVCLRESGYPILRDLIMISRDPATAAVSASKEREDLEQELVRNHRHRRPLIGQRSNHRHRQDRLLDR